MGKYRKILVAVDSSDSGKNALHQAFKLANEEKCWITVTSVVPPYEGEIETLGVRGHPGGPQETLRGRHFRSGTYRQDRADARKNGL